MHWFCANFRLPFLIDLHVSGCPEYDLTISRKYLFVCVTKAFTASVAKELINRIQ